MTEDEVRNRELEERGVPDGDLSVFNAPEVGVYEIPEVPEMGDVRAGSVDVPVDLGLLEEVPTDVSGQPYATPELAQQALARKIEERVAGQVATVRDENSLRIANMAQDGAAHFLVNVEGSELCGSCGEPFPCTSWTGEIEPRNAAESSGQPVADEDKARALAELLNISLEQARQMVLMATPLDKL